jgi:hypothetical protein
MPNHKRKSFSVDNIPCVFGADLKSNMAEILKIFLSETTKPTEL